MLHSSYTLLFHVTRQLWLKTYLRGVKSGRDKFIALTHWELPLVVNLHILVFNATTKIWKSKLAKCDSHMEMNPFTAQNFTSEAIPLPLVALPVPLNAFSILRHGPPQFPLGSWNFWECQSIGSPAAPIGSFCWIPTPYRFLWFGGLILRIRAMFGSTGSGKSERCKDAFPWKVSGLIKVQNMKYVLAENTLYHPPKKIMLCFIILLQNAFWFILV